MQTDAIFHEINTRWHSDDPFSMAVNTGRSVQKYISAEYAMPKHAAKFHVEAWVEQKMLENAIHNKVTKAKGIKVLRNMGDS